MIFQRVVDVTEPTHNSRRPVEHFMTSNSDYNLNQNENDSLTSDALLPKLDNFPPDEDGPEIFKRVRLLTRWEDRRESRGRLCYLQRNGDGSGLGIWKANGEVAINMKDNLAMRCAQWGKWIFAGASATCCMISICFMGKTITSSRPAIFIYASEKKARRRILKVTQEVDWVRQNPHFLACVCPLPKTIKHFLMGQQLFEAWEQHNTSLHRGWTRICLIDSSQGFECHLMSPAHA